jgi:hypothetical protein
MHWAGITTSRTVYNDYFESSTPARLFNSEMKSISFFTAFAIGAMSPAYALAQSGESTWGVAEVDSYIRGVQAAALKASDDPFTKPAGLAAPADRIVFRFPFLRPRESDRKEPPFHNPFWRYDAVSEQLTLQSYAPDDGAELRLDTQGQREAFRLKVLGVDVYYDSREKEAGVYQNAYGSRTVVTNLNIESRGIGELRSVQNFRDELIFNAKQFTDIRTIEPEKARELTKHLEMEIEATPDEWAPGKWVICGAYNDTPTLESPKRLSKTGCYLTVRYKAFRYIDARNGEVLKEWKRAGSVDYLIHRPTLQLGK